MLIFGLHVSRILMATPVYVCERCGNNAAHQLVKRVRKFSLFFIPLFPVGTRYEDTCTACGRVIDVSADQARVAAGAAGGAAPAGYGPRDATEYGPQDSAGPGPQDSR